MTEDVVIIESSKRQELLEGEIPTAKAKLEAAYKMLRELHKSQIRATEKLAKIAEERLHEMEKLARLLAQTEQALAIKNRILEQMSEGHATERSTFAQEIQDLKLGKRKRR